LDLVQVRIEQSDGGGYWNGSNWVADENTWVSASGTDPWSVVHPTCTAPASSNWCDNRLYTVHARARDRAVPDANLSGWTTAQFTVDLTSPTVMVSDPDLDYEAGLPDGITGTASDGANPRKSGIYGVQVAIRQPPIGAGGWWNGTSGFTIADNKCDGGADDTCWVYASTNTADPVVWQYHSTPTWVNNTQYSIKVRSKDNAGNYSPDLVTNFTYDTSGPPTVAILKPIVEGKYKAEGISAISGTAYDLWRVVSSSISIREKNSRWWNGSTFGATTEQWHAVTLTGPAPNYTWTWPLPGGAASSWTSP
jgi:hypothetical protein